jgi:hypothetical protein
MAALQERNGSYRIIFNYRGKQRAFTLGRVAEAEAKAKAAQVDYLLMRLRQGLIEMPPGIDVVAFFRHDGALCHAVPCLAGGADPRRPPRPLPRDARQRHA